MTTAEPEDPDEQPVPAGIDASRPNVARMYDYWLGGSVNYPIDRQAADQILHLEPLAIDSAWANRGFLQRAATWMAQRGIDQILDLGAGLPTMNNTHETVHHIDPNARVVYVDSDPEVIAHGRHLISNVDGADYVRGDLRNLESVLTDPTVSTLDFSRPVGAPTGWFLVSSLVV